MKAIWLATLLTIAQQATADELTGANLYASCITAQPGSNGDFFCNVYISGFTKGVALQGMLAGLGNPICFPPDGTPLQARLIIQRYLQAHPENLHLSAGALAAQALVEAFPCRKRN
jgi:Rap1a immunity proteins